MDIQSITNWLLENGLSQKEIAKQTGLSQPTISDISKGKIGVTRPSHRAVTQLTKLRNRVQRRMNRIRPTSGDMPLPNSTAFRDS